MEQDSVLVLGNFPQTLAVVRSLGRAGFRVVLGDSGEPSIARRSRFCSEVWGHPDLEDQAAFQPALAAFLASRSDVRYVFPVAERSIRALVSTHCLADREIDLVMVRPDLVRRCMDKFAANDLAVEAGLRIPETRLARNHAELNEHGLSIGFPVIVKPLGSALRLLGRKAWIVPSAEALTSSFPDWPAEHESLLVQRYISGTLEAADFVARSGVLVGYCEAHSLRTDTLDGTGFGVEFESIPPTPDVLEATRAFAAALEYTGPGLIQFMRCAETGTLYFLENNPRLSAGIADSIACGQDMPLLSLRAASTRPESQLPQFDPDNEPYQVHHHAYWLQRDIEGWLTQRANLSRRQKLSWLADMARSFARADSHINWQWDDPLPVLSSYGGLLRRVASGFTRQLARRPG